MDSPGAHNDPAIQPVVDGPVSKERQILNGAAIVFARDGYEGASMSRIAREAGVSKGTLYNYFAGKAELFTAYVQRDCSLWIALMFEDLDEGAPPPEVLKQIGLRQFTMLLSEPALIMYRMVIAEAEKFPELAHTFYKAGPAHAVAHVAAYLRRAAGVGLLRVDDPEFAAEQFFALLQTHLCMKRRLRLIAMPAPAEIEKIVFAAVEMFLRSYQR